MIFYIFETFPSLFRDRSVSKHSKRSMNFVNGFGQKSAGNVSKMKESLYLKIIKKSYHRYLGILSPTTPATTGPLWQPKFFLVQSIRSFELIYYTIVSLPTLIFIGTLVVGFSKVAMLSSMSKAMSTISFACFSVRSGKPETTF